MLSSDERYGHRHVCNIVVCGSKGTIAVCSSPLPPLPLCAFSGDLDSHRPVPFRLTPTIAEFLTPTGISGPLTAGMIAAARCLVQPQYKAEAFLRAILRDEYITWNKKVMIPTWLSLKCCFHTNSTTTTSLPFHLLFNTISTSHAYRT